MTEYFCISVYFCSLRHLLQQSQKPENRGSNLMPSQDKTWICSIDNESETYRLKECLLDLFSASPQTPKSAQKVGRVIQCQWSSSRLCLFNDNNSRALPLISSLSDMWSCIQILTQLSKIAGIMPCLLWFMLDFPSLTFFFSPPPSCGTWRASFSLSLRGLSASVPLSADL